MLPDIDQFTIGKKFVMTVIESTLSPAPFLPVEVFDETVPNTGIMEENYDNTRMVSDHELINWITIGIKDLIFIKDQHVSNLNQYPTIRSTSQYMKLNCLQHQIFVKCALSLIQSWIFKLNLVIPADEIPNLNTKKQPQLVAHLIGPAGYGKSRVIHALSVFASKWNKRDTLLVTAFTGTAAKNVCGLNMHAVFGWMVMNELKAKITNETRVKLSRVTFIIIDEISSCAQYLIGCLSNAFQQITGSNEVLGGMHCLLVGDWLQLPPVGATTLFSNPSKYVSISDSSSSYEGKVLGRLVWDKINYFVVLKDNIRHRGNEMWINILDRMRVGKLCQPDIDWINKTCHDEGETKRSVNYNYTPLLTASNTTRCEFNRQCTYQYALHHNQTIYQIPAIYKGHCVEKSLYSINDNKTGKQCMLLELVIGMPLMCTTNDKQKGLTNGSIGTLVGIQWPDKIQFTSQICSNGTLIQFASTIPDFLFFKDHDDNNCVWKNLPKNVIPISCPQAHKVTFEFDGLKRRSRNLRQLAVIPAWGITTDKSQGMTLQSCILGAQSDCIRKNPPKQILYVAWSRVIDPSNIHLVEKVSLESMKHYAPSKELLMVESQIRSKYVKEFQ